MRIKITQDMLDYSICTNPKHCIIAEAVNTKLKPGLYASVWPGEFNPGIVTIKESVQNRIMCSIELNDKVNQIAVDFDAYNPPEVGTYITVDIPEEALR